MITELAITYPTTVSGEERPQAILNFARGIRDMGDRAKIMLATAWFEIRKEGYWQSLTKPDGRGYASFDEYIMGEFTYGKSTSAALIGVYETYVVGLGYMPEDISGIPWFHLRALIPIINKDNAAEYLEKVKNMTQQEVTKFVKELRGTPEVKEREKKFTVALKPLQTEICDHAMELAQEATGSEIPGLNLEYICADFVCSNDLKDSSKITPLAEWIERIERLFGVKLKVVDDQEPVASEGDGVGVEVV